jgi:gluconate 2-dehydrogenase alpha chain
MPPSVGVGGGSIYWACWSWRQLREDFRQHSTLVERYGKEKLPEGSHIVDWPISYDDLEPYYDRVEYETGISGQPGRQHKRRDTGGW